MMLSVAKTLALVKRAQEKERLAEAKHKKSHRDVQRLRCKAKERPTPPPDHLFALPPELRLQIYAETFRKDFIDARPRGTSRDSRRKFILRVISLLRVCGQVRREALDVFTECLKEEIIGCRAFARSPKKHWDGSLCATRCQYYGRKGRDLLWHVSYLQELQGAVKGGEVFYQFAARTSYRNRLRQEVLEKGKRSLVIPVYVAAGQSEQVMDIDQAVVRPMMPPMKIVRAQRRHAATEKRQLRRQGSPSSSQPDARGEKSQGGDIPTSNDAHEVGSASKQAIRRSKRKVLQALDRSTDCVEIARLELELADIYRVG
ncbi:hypothetical protein B0A48_16797 [Cryoendolithus antarcticus]|uniref:Uncharacterized protein n=1 Tax=Cryoendolithus antarcticus TaxID=1507870 RepID=A0A1V8SDN1_9PEZI|nr:hypothetical protein B0A48_16797 [Cryoendolithus antarcticus]